MSLGENKHLLLTTYRRDRTLVSTPVWAVSLDVGTVGFWTSSRSGKAKRLGHTEAVVVQPCDGRGRVTEGSEPIDAVAHLVDGAGLEAIRAKVVAKYGFMTKLTRILNSVGGTLKRNRVPHADLGVVITPSV
jgi:uncharacterized protein